MPEPARILIVRPSALGDVCRTVPVLAALKRRHPDAYVHWLVNEAFAPAVVAHPDLSAVIPFPRGRLGAWWRSPSAARELRAWLGSLRAARYDLVLDCQGLFRSGLFTRWTGAPRRIGYANAREMGWLGLNERVHAPRARHALDRMMALAHAAGADPGEPPDLRLYCPAADREALKPDLAQARYALLAPTSRWVGKRWPVERFAALATRLLDERLVERVAFVGAASERGQCEPLARLAVADHRVLDLVGATSVGGLMAAVERAAIVVANDSAALHMAVGFARPLVALFGPTHVGLVGPYRREADVIQKIAPGERLDHKDEALGRRLMERISVDEAFAAAAARMSGADTMSPC
ncbi:MAG: glycosyltransferase family 9 protein [Phycisphaerales bacterium]|nr:glycosyltransferase family 9 protein [Phycisphaerales bacterium]